MNLLFVADIFANGGKRVLSELLPGLRREFSVDVCVANGENLAGGHGVTKNLLGKLRKFGVDVVTGPSSVNAPHEIFPLVLS